MHNAADEECFGREAHQSTTPSMWTSYVKSILSREDDVTHSLWFILFRRDFIWMNEWVELDSCACVRVCRILTWFTLDYYILLYLLRVFRACAWVSVCLSVRVEFWPGSHSDYYILLYRPTRVSVCLIFFKLFWLACAYASVSRFSFVRFFAQKFCFW